MAYTRKYYKHIESQGNYWTLNIYQDTDLEIAPKGIGPVLQGLRLVMQGDQADIDTPIVKTSLEMVFVDAPDLEDDRKNGFWEEFYTSSSTEYRVELIRNGSKEWSGYITPDSFSEDLRYRGSVTIIARDNLGTLQDLTCDLTKAQNIDGKVQIYRIIQEAMTASTCPMTLENISYFRDDLPYATDLETAGTYLGLMSQWVDVQMLREKNWWQALEDILYSVGLVIRYVGRNTLRLMALRDMPKYGEKYWWNVDIMDVTFKAHGRRELIPAVRSITETNEFELNIPSDPEQITDYAGRATRNLHNLTFYGPDGSTSVGPTVQVPAWGYTNPKSKESITAANSALLNVENYPKLQGEDSTAYGQWDDKGIMYYAVNAYDPTAFDSILYPLSFSQMVWSAKAKVTVSLILDKPVTLTTDYSKVLNLPIKSRVTYGTSPMLYYRLKITSSGGATVNYFNASTGGWGSSSVVNTYSIGTQLFIDDKPNPKKFELKDLSVPFYGTLTLEIVKIYIQTLEIQLRQPCVGMFMRIRDVRMNTNIPEESITMADKITVTTNYSDKYSVRITRKPEFAINPTIMPEVAYIPNAILTDCDTEYGGADMWTWLHGRDAEILTFNNTEGISLSRLIHQQLLAYHAQPNNQLTGEVVNKESSLPNFRSLYRWNGVDHMLISGTLNILTGRMENAVLRQFTRYDHMWETHITDGENRVGESAAYTELVTLKTVKTITKSDVKNLPSWITVPRIHNGIDGVSTIVLLSIAANTSSSIRRAIIQIDTAYMQITQYNA